MTESRRPTRSMLAFLLCLALLTAASTASPGGSPQRPTSRPTKPKVSLPEPKPVPDIKLVIEAATARGPWRMRAINVGDVPVRISADASLLSFEVTPRGARSAVRCELPEDMRPNNDRERALVVPPKRAYAASFEPRLYCFGEKLEALAPGAVVVARLGWPGGPKTGAPFEVTPIEGIDPELAPLKSIESEPIALPDEPSVPLVPEAAHPQNVEVDAPRLSLQGAAAVDANSPNDIEIPVTLRNDDERTVVLRFRPEVLAFDVIGPGGIEHCAWPAQPSAPTPEVFASVPPNGTETLDIGLADYCTRGSSLDQGGLLVVRPRLDTRNASGVSLGLRTFDGTLIATKPTVVRLHRGAAQAGPLRRPRLEPQ
jgi:hypothetical protein